MKRLLLEITGCLFVLASLPAAAAERYAALFSDGTRVEEAEVREWFEPTSVPKIAGRALFDPANPVRWVLDRQQPLQTEPAAFVEFEGGDRLAGEVVSFQPESGLAYHQQPAHLVVRPLAEIQPPDEPQLTQVRVGLDWLRRIVWQKASVDDHRPGTVWLRNGGLQSFRTLRWSDAGVTLLTTEGIKEFSFEDLAEVHLPKSDPWAAYADQLSLLSPDLKSRLIQLETAEGSRWTTSQERFHARHHGDRNRPESWIQFIQPAWSLDPLWLRYRSVRLWRFHAPTDVPLTNVPPSRVERRAVFGSGWTWRVNQNVQRGPLQSAAQEYGWGFGVQASCDLAFEWPEMARAWRTQFGLDRAAASGGFVRLSFQAGPGQGAGPTPTLQGSQAVGDTGWLALPTLPPEQRQLVLRADMAHTDRPADADPFDIRDAVNWYEPELRLDPAALATRVQGRGLHRIDGLHGWTLAPADQAGIALVNQLDASYGRDPVYRVMVGTRDRFYTLTRRIKIPAGMRWLSLAASRFPDSTPTFVQIRLAEQTVGEFEVPIRNTPSDPDPMLVSVEGLQGKTIPVELVVMGTDAKSLVDWRGMALTRERPGLLTIFEDEPSVAAQLNRAAGTVDVVGEQPFSGAVSLKVTPDAGDNPRLPGLDVAIVDNPRLGQYRFVAFAWKQSTGARVQIQFANDGRLGEIIAQMGRRAEQLKGKPARGLSRFDGPPDDRGLRHGYAYDAGNERQTAGSPLRLNGALPKDWQLLSRDLYGDFGSFNLTGLALSCVGGEAAWFDHIYLARTYQDLELARTYMVNSVKPPGIDPSLLDQAYNRNEYGRVLAPFTHQFSSPELSHGVHRLKEHFGQTDVLRTHANAQDKPAIFRTGLTLPADKPKMVDLVVSHGYQTDWQLVVKVNGEVVHSELINDKLTLLQRGWASVQVDLSRFAGQKVYLEVLNQSNNWMGEYAFWKRMAIADR